MDNNFVTWLTGELDERGWSNSELARRAGMVPSTISMVISERNGPSLDFCVKVAGAFDLPPEFVLRKAGLLPEVPPQQAREDEIVRLYRQVPATHRDLALRVMSVFASAAPTPNIDAFAQLEPGETVLLRSWTPDHPLVRVMARLESNTEEEIRDYLLRLLAEAESRRVLEKGTVPA